MNRRRRITVMLAAAVALVATTALVAVAATGGLLTQASSGVQGAAEYGDFFGAAVATGDFDGDGYDDVLVGVPDENVGSKRRAGTIQVLYGSATGVTASGDLLIHAGSSGVAGAVEPGDLLGYAVATGDFDGDGYDDAAIGSPGEDVGSTVDAGGILILYGTADGLKSTRSRALSQASTGVRGAAEAHDSFGQSLAVGDFDGDGKDDLAIGIPGEAVGTKAGAGAVQVLFGTSSGLSASGDQLFGQDSAGVSGTAEPNDTFGWSLAAGDFDGDGDDDLAVGAPGEALGTKVGAGIVQVFPGGSDGLDLSADKVLSQSTAGIAGGAEPDDFFGESLAAADVDGDGRDDLAIGAPGEALGSKPAGGTAYVLYGTASGITGSGSRGVTQASKGVRGTAEAGDEFGLTVGLGDINGDGFADFIAGAPGEGIGSSNGSGVVHVFYGRASGYTVAGDELWWPGTDGLSGSPEPNAGFGRAIAIGDVDGDGVNELIVGAPGTAASGRDGAGAIMVISG